MLSIKSWLQTAACRRIAISGLFLLATGIAWATTIYLTGIYQDPTGQIATATTNGPIDTTNPFFQSLGTNGRTCATCHTISGAWSLAASHAQQLFAATNGSDPLFAPVDGANCPDATASDAAAHSLILQGGLFRIALPVPANAAFSIQVMPDPDPGPDSPYNCAITYDSQGNKMISVYRRPLPGTNLRFLTAVMFDGREDLEPITYSDYMPALTYDLEHQALDATLDHAQATTAPTSTQLQEIADFELGTDAAQLYDNAAGDLDDKDTTGGPVPLTQQAFYPGINDSLGSNPTGAAFNPQVFTLYDNWLNLKGQDSVTLARESIARGEEIFNSFPLKITAVTGLNNVLNEPVINGTCSTCHDAPNVGDHSLAVPLDIGTSHTISDPNPLIASAVAQLQTQALNLPVYKLTCLASGAVTITSDPGRALISGNCADIGRGKGLVLRGLAARAPYFHNGAAANLQQLVNFYDIRFQMGLTAQQKQDLINFLLTL